MSADVQTGSVWVDGLEVRYHDSVNDFSGLAPVMLVHGTGGNTDSHFPFIFPMLATRQRVVSVDLATPDCDPQLGPQRLAAQVAAVIKEALPGQPVTLVGYSLGAVVAAIVAAENAALIGKLVLLAGWMKSDSHQKLRNDVWQALRRHGDLDALGRHFVFCAYSAQFLAWCPPQLIDHMAHSSASDDATAAQMEMNRHVDLTDLASQIGCPTLIVAGSDDQMTPYRQSKALFGAIEDARYTEVTSGHAMIAERPAELIHLVTTFNENPLRHPAGSIIPRQRP